MSKSQVLGMIPARYGSTRFPGKLLKTVLGKTVLQRTFESAKQCPSLDAIVVATDDTRIKEHVEGLGGLALMTSPSCPTGSDRIAEALEKHPQLKGYDIVVNIQGDHPCLRPETMSALVQALKGAPDAVMATAAIRVEDADHSSHAPKVVMDRNGYALYFSRGLIPAGHTGTMKRDVAYYHHLGIYAFRRDFLLRYGQLEATPLQMAEDLEQLKILEHGYRIKLVVVEDVAMGVDVPEDVKKVEDYLCTQQNTSLSLAASSLR